VVLAIMVLSRESGSRESHGHVRQDMASRLFALDGAEVVEVDAEAAGSRTV
jgi:hypothetical protein